MEHPDDNFDDFDQELLPYRRDLLPWWIKFFSFIFIILGGFAIVNTVMLLFGWGIYASIYGLETVLPEPFDTLVALPLIILNGIAGHMLLYEKDQALVWGKIAAIAGIVVATFATCMSAYTGHFMFRFELIALIPFLLKLHEMRYEWKYESRKR